MSHTLVVGGLSNMAFNSALYSKLAYDLAPDLRTRTPPEAIAKLRRDIRASLPELKERFEKSGGEVWDLPDDKLDAFVASEYESWTKLIREAGIKLD